ncbi:hypothetical protein OPV22_018501 [Ensete ventricosum]|uniref:Uncharacterized protein n=1 Tax=Ensete ventricosum TaxID=4639 RepID=A0AAV8QVR7_ENSVE|nr:hypothetical protein OPV22_018501 [Ensete ventricosum]
MAAIPRASLGLVAIMLLALDIVLPSVHAQAPAPAPTSDGASIDQGIAYLLLLVALDSRMPADDEAEHKLKAHGRLRDALCLLQRLPFISVAHCPFTTSVSTTPMLRNMDGCFGVAANALMRT